MNDATHAYAKLGPDLILDAVESKGWLCSGRFLALNSYENRVYQVGLEEGGAVVVKFYRPERWSDDTIREGHAFASELENNEILVATPFKDEQGETLFEHEGFRFAVFPSIGGRHPELDRDEHLEWLGRYIGRIHMVGAGRPFEHRRRLDVDAMAVQSYQYLLAEGFIPAELEVAYRTTAEDVVSAIKSRFDGLGGYRALRLHGDCHVGNVLWTEQGPTFLDLDDCIMGPAIQDLWMLLSGDRRDMEMQLSILMEGYEQFFEFDPAQLILVDALRSMRMLSYSAWLARRWDDPAFPIAFPWFNTSRYWEEQILSLREQLSAFDEPSLRLL